MHTISASELRRYPVKSMQGELVESVTLGPLGINGDRHHAIRDVATGKVISAKHPKHGKVLLSFSAVFDEMTKNVSVISPDGDNFDADDPTLARVLSDALSTEVVVDGASADTDVYESYWPPIEGLALSDTTADFAVAMMTNKHDHPATVPSWRVARSNRAG
jgi:uncharacterized protein